jgi:hypothetical protein
MGNGIFVRGEEIMDAPIASLMMRGLLKGYENRAKKEDEEAEDLVRRIDTDALKKLCARYDIKEGDYPEHEYEGAFVFEFFEKMKREVEGRRRRNAEEGDVNE